MDFRLAKEIYSQAWYVDHATISGLMSVLDFHKQNNAFEVSEKSNSFGVIPLSKTKVVDRPYQLSDVDDEDSAVSLIKLDGVITKSGGASHNGTVQLARQLRAFDSSDKIKGHVLFIDSGGGSAVAVAELTEAIDEINKPVVAFVDGIMASAAMYIGSYADYIFSHRATDTIGSIGTMVEFNGFPKKAENEVTKERHVRIYASASTLKNNHYEEAIENYNFKPVTEKILNPFNERFISAMEANRPNIREIEKTGEIFQASEVVGTLIDEIGTLEQAINKVLDLSGASSNININQNSKMNLAELKQKHPDLYQEVISAERDRVNAYLTFAHLDLDAVKAGIESGNAPSLQFHSEMTLKGIAAQTVQAVETDAPEAIITGEEKAPESDTSAELKAAEKAAFEAAGLTYKEGE